MIVYSPYHVQTPKPLGKWLRFPRILSTVVPTYSFRDAGGITEIQLGILGERRYLPSGLYR